MVPNKNKYSLEKYSYRLVCCTLTGLTHDNLRTLILNKKSWWTLLKKECHLLTSSRTSSGCVLGSFVGFDFHSTNIMPKQGLSLCRCLNITSFSQCGHCYTSMLNKKQMRKLHQDLLKWTKKRWVKRTLGVLLCSFAHSWRYRWDTVHSLKQSSGKLSIVHSFHGIVFP